MKKLKYYDPKDDGWNVVNGAYIKHYKNGCTGTAEYILGWTLKDENGVTLASGDGTMSEGIYLCDCKFSALFPNVEV